MLVLLFSACRKDNIDTNIYDQAPKQYAPFTVDSELYYIVDSTTYDDFNDTSYTQRWYRRCSIDSLNNSITGRTLFRVSISERTDTLKVWNHVRVDQWALTQQYFETQEQNVRFTHLIFPVNYESTWNVNQYNTFRKQLRYYLAFNDTFMMDNILYNEVLKVENEPKTNSVVNIQYKEVFAKNIGCIYKKITNIETQFGSPRGYAVTVKLYDYKL